MTRDEVLEEAARAAEACGRDLEDNYGAHTGHGEAHADAIRALKSKPPEKSPELTLESNPYDTNAMGHAELADLVFDLHRRWMGEQARYAALLAQRDRELVAATALQRELPQFDCRRTGGPVSDVDGIHCPIDRPCMRCRLRNAEEAGQRLRAELTTESAQANEWLTQLHDAQKELTKAKAQATEAEATVDRMRWEARGAPMRGETADGELTSAERAEYRHVIDGLFRPVPK